jgi:hypothetical protein
LFVLIFLSFKEVGPCLITCTPRRCILLLCTLCFFVLVAYV